MGKDFDPSSYVESGRNEGSEQAPYAVNRNGKGTPSGATMNNGGNVADGATYGGGITAG